VFFAKNAVSALKLGQARGVVLLTAAVHDLEIYEYSVTEVKSTLTGHGRADKEQVAKMLTLMMGAKDFATLDASDALALAAAHAMKGADPAGSRSSLGGARKSSKKSGNSLKALAEAKLGKSRQ
jgi:crossover junction endodeoxyribonuclease RuvC